MSGVDLLVIDEFIESFLKELFYDKLLTANFLLIGTGLTNLTFIVSKSFFVFK